MLPRDQSPDDYLELAEQANAERLGPQAGMWLERLGAEHTAFLTALQSFIEAKRVPEAQRLAAALGWFWGVRGHIAEGREWLARVLDLDDARTRARAQAAYAAGLLAFRQGDNAISRTLNGESLSIARALDDRPAIVMALVGLSRVGLRDLDYAGVRANAEEALTIAEELGDPHGQVMPVHILAELARLEGKFAPALERYDQSLALNRQLGNQYMVAMELCNKGHVVLNLGDLPQAQELFTESLQMEQSSGGEMGVAYCLIGLASVAADGNNPERAVRLFSAAGGQFERLGAVIDPTDRADYDRHMQALRIVLGQQSFEAAYEQGRALLLDEAVDYAKQPLDSK